MSKACEMILRTNPSVLLGDPIDTDTPTTADILRMSDPDSSDGLFVVVDFNPFFFFIEFEYFKLVYLRIFVFLCSYDR